MYEDVSNIPNNFKSTVAKFSKKTENLLKDQTEMLQKVSVKLKKNTVMILYFQYSKWRCHEKAARGHQHNLSHKSDLE